MSGKSIFHIGRYPSFIICRSVDRYIQCTLTQYRTSHICNFCELDLDRYLDSNMIMFMFYTHIVQTNIHYLCVKLFCSLQYNTINWAHTISELFSHFWFILIKQTLCIRYWKVQWPSLIITYIYIRLISIPIICPSLKQNISYVKSPLVFTLLRCGRLHQFISTSIHIIRLQCCEYCEQTKSKTQINNISF